MLMSVALNRLQVLAGVALALGAVLEAIGKHDAALILMSAGVAWGTTSAREERPAATGGRGLEVVEDRVSDEAETRRRIKSAKLLPKATATIEEE